MLLGCLKKSRLRVCSASPLEYTHWVLCTTNLLTARIHKWMVICKGSCLLSTNDSCPNPTSKSWNGKVHVLFHLAKRLQALLMGRESTANGAGLLGTKVKRDVLGSAIMLPQGGSLQLGHDGQHSRYVPSNDSNLGHLCLGST